MTTLRREQGDTYPDRYQLFSKETKTYVDITGATFQMLIDPSSNPLNSDNTDVIAGVVVDQATSKVEFTFTNEIANKYGVYYFWVKMTDSLGLIRTVDHGSYTFH